MIFVRLLAVALMLGASLASRAPADDVNHFRGFPPPPDEARILALTGVLESRCHYEIAPSSVRFLHNPLFSNNHYQADFNLFAELYTGTTCTARYRLAIAVDGFTDLTKPRTGLLSMGWNQEQHELTSVIDNRQLYSPWRAAVHLPGFSMVDAHFFENSTGEKRHSPQSGDFVIYPVIGICGDRQMKIGDRDAGDAAAYLQACARAHAKSAVIVYLYSSSLGNEAPLKYDPAP